MIILRRLIAVLYRNTISTLLLIILRHIITVSFLSQQNIDIIANNFTPYCYCIFFIATQYLNYC